MATRRQFVTSVSTLFILGEVVSGTQDFSNTTFTVSDTPIDSSLVLYQNGQRLKYTTDYTVSAKTITMVEAPHTDDVLIADYMYKI